MFDHMEITESICKGVVEPSYNNLNRADVKRAGQSRQKREEAASPWTNPEKGESAGKRRKGM